MSTARLRSSKQCNTWLVGIIPLVSPIEIVDIGASPLGGKPPYANLFNAGVARVTGFEPNPEQFEKLDQLQSKSRRYLPYAIGDGNDATLNVTHHRGFTSTLTPDASIHHCIENFADATRVVNASSIQTHRLADLEEIERIDLLKIDIQGGEINALSHAGNKLAQTLYVHTEVAFVPMYIDQPLIGEQIELLAKHQFNFYGFYSQHSYPLFNQKLGFPHQAASEGMTQLLDADAVFMKDFRQVASLPEEQLKRLALISHFVYDSHTITNRCLELLETSGYVAPGTTGEYAAFFR